MPDPTIMLGFEPTYAPMTPPEPRSWLSLAAVAAALGVTQAVAAEALTHARPRTVILATGEPETQVALNEAWRVAKALGRPRPAYWPAEPEPQAPVPVPVDAQEALRERNAAIVLAAQRR